MIARRVPLLAAAVAVVLLPNGLWAQSSSPSDASIAEHPRVAQTLTLLDRWAAAELAYDDVPGASLAVVHDQERVWAHAWGRARPEENVPATPNTTYSICSISKLFTSVAAMDLWERDRLALTDPVGAHLAWFDMKERHDGLTLTIESLLTHSSGLPRESDYSYWTPPDFEFPSRADIRQRIQRQETLYPPRHYFQYSNLGLTLVGEVVASTADTSYSEFIQQRVLQPLNLSDTAPSIPWNSDRMARGFSAVTRSGDRTRVSPFEANGITPAAGYSSTVLDLTRFASWQFRLLDDDTTQVLRPSTLRKMHNVHWVDPDFDVHWGLGFSVWRSDGETYVGHGGSCPGFRSHLALQPSSELAAAVAANANGVNSSRFTETAIQALAPAISAAQDTTESTETPPESFEKYVGNYSTQPWGGEMAVIPWKDGLAFVGLPTNDPLDALEELEHVEGHTFRRIREDGEPAETIRFRTNEAGDVDALVHHSNVWPRMPAPE